MPGKLSHNLAVDANQAEIVATLRSLDGVTVAIIGRPLDLLVGYLGINYLLEVKMPKAHLTQDQRHFFQTWKGHRTVVTAPEEAVDAIGWQRVTLR